MSKLSANDRKHISKKNFAVPSKAPGSGSYPIEDRAHAINALARVKQHGSPSQQAQVKRKVYNKYPGLKHGKK